jgi:Protein of unknown function (DUF935)
LPAPSAPTTELGQATQGAPSLAGLAGGGTFIDEFDYAGKMLWPARFDPVERMLTDSQIKGLRMGCELPIRRFRWFIDPQDARPEVYEGIAKDFNLPLKGQTDFQRGRRKGRFSHGRHLQEALRALWHGFAYFEQYGKIGEDGLWHLRKLAPRPPRTMREGHIKVARDGGLEAIVQGFGMAPKPIPVDRLLAYIWDQEAGNWTGRSMLRECYRPWLAKDMAFRVAPLHLERNGMGVPIIEAPQGATPEQIAALSAMAQQYRSGDRAGGALPHGAKLTLQGVQGNVPDAVGFMRFCNEEMAKSLLQMFANLGQSDTGSHSLAEDFIGLFSYALEGVADWYADTTTEHAIEDWVDWNYGEDEAAPALGYERAEEEELAVADLATLVEKGIVQVDPELEEGIRRKYKLPAGPGHPTPPAEPSSPEPAAVQAKAKARERRRTTVAAAADSLRLPDRDLRRQPYSQEVQAKVDYELMDAQIQGQIDSLVAKVKTLQGDQITELAAAIESADNDLTKLAQIEAAPVFADTLEDAMHTMAAQGVEQAMGEAERQGITPKAPDLDTTSLTSRANAVDTLLTRSLGEAAGRKAVSLTAESGAISASDVASQVGEYLSGLSDDYLKQQLSGATVQAMNTGRKAVFAENPPKYLYASELLDENACEECTAVDGTEYDSLEEAEADYPTGGYAECLGGPRCRGTLVAVHVDEEAPSK